MAIYKGKVKLEDLFIDQLVFKDGLIPTIVQDSVSKTVLMLAYSNKESLLRTFSSGNCWYWSRSRQKLWMKGETSGNVQELVRVKYDCDKDTLLFVVDQIGGACHLGGYSCFGEKEKGVAFFEELYQVLDGRRDATISESYTKKLLENPNLLLSKIEEEAGEVIEASSARKEDLIWEIADLMYFLMVLMVKRRICFQEVVNELVFRRK